MGYFGREESESSYFGIMAACATIEEVGSTGVGALTITFLILGVSSAVFAYKGHNSHEQKR